MKQKLVAGAKFIAANVLKREVVFLPLGRTETARNGSTGGALLPVRYTYRASPDGVVTYQLEAGGHDLHYSLFTPAFPEGRIEGATLGQLCFSCRLPSVNRGDTLQVNLTEPNAWINGEPVQPLVREHRQTRKFVAELRLSSAQRLLSRQCSHYLPFEGKPIGKDYYFGDDYVNYPLHTNVDYALDLLRQYCLGGKLLDVGCALGLYTEAFLAAGFDAYGVDISEFATSEAAARVGQDRVRRCDLDVSEIPFDTAFDVLWVWDVLEHSADPANMLQKLTEKAARGGFLFLHTANADSLTHRVLQTDWEGYSDYSHRGVDTISAASLRAWLQELGWETLDWHCTGIWVNGPDPVLLRLRDTFHNNPELATLLTERDLGDMILVVARKR